MISSLAIFGAGGEILVYRSLKADVGPKEALLYSSKFIAAREVGQAPPVVTIAGCSFLSVSQADLTFMAATRVNPNATLVMTFLYRFIQLLKYYCSLTVLTERAIRRNVVLIYELIDEIIDFGIPQILEIDVLKKYITQGGAKLDNIGQQEIRTLTVQATGATAWRAEGIKYRKNEVYLDVVEFINVLVSKQGQVLNADVTGKVILKCLLSGIPECKFGMNDKLPLPAPVAGTGPKSVSLMSGIATSTIGPRSHTTNYTVTLDDIRFHQCVRISSMNQERTITFVPPDGTFELITYRATSNVQLPFHILPSIVERGRHRIEYSVKLRATFPQTGIASNVVMKIPCPKTAARAEIVTTTFGKARFEATASTIVWRIKKLAGQSQAIFKGVVHLAPSVTDIRWSRPPICLDFQVPMFTSSGLTVRFLRVYEKSNYKTVKWIRYITRAGNYQIQTDKACCCRGLFMEEPATERLRCDTDGGCFLTLTGQALPAFDPVVINIAGKIEEVLEAFPEIWKQGSTVSLEVEGRLGVLKDDERIRLPIETEAVLDPPSEALPYRFEASVTPFHFRRLLESVHDVLQLPHEQPFKLPEDARVFRVDPVQHIQTEDEFRDVSASVFEELGIPGDDEFAPRRIRASYSRPRVPGAPPKEIIWKRRLHVLNIYTGRSNEGDNDTNESSGVDIRIGINLEYTLPTSVLQDSRPDSLRRRDRVSYPLRHKYRLDATLASQVASKNQSADTTYEVEVEMNPLLLVKEVRKKQSGQRHHLYRLVKDFLGILRDFAAFLNSRGAAAVSCQRHNGIDNATTLPSSSKALQTELANLSECAQDNASLQRYLTYISPVVPLIGDYLFRAVALDRASSQAEPVSPEDIEASLQIVLPENEAQALRDRLRGDA